MLGSHAAKVASYAAALAALIVSSALLAQEPKSAVPAESAESAEPAEPAASADPDAAVWQAAGAAMQHGPQVIELRDQGSLQLPEGYGFVPVKEATAVMELMGNQTDERFLGLIFPTSEADWFVSIDYEPSGYIKDDDAKEWDADELLDSLKEGTEAGNEHREQMGVPPIEVTRWIETPSYDSPSHQLVWSAEVREKGGEDQDPTVNYNTYVLGREGYFSLNLITSASQVETDKPAAKQLLAAVSFSEGKRYGDFNESTDKVAAYGLAALVGGIAAKKLGLLAAIGLFLAKFAKIIIVGVIALGGVVMKLFKRRNASEPAS